MDKRYMAVWISVLAFNTVAADPLQELLQPETLNKLNKIEGNVTVGNLENTTVNATAVAVGRNSHAAAGGVINRNNKGGVINRNQRAEVDLSGARIDARAEAANGKEAFAGAYVNK